MSIAIPPTTKTITVEVSRFPKPQRNILAEPSQILKNAEEKYIKHLQKKRNKRIWILY